MRGRAAHRIRQRDLRSESEIERLERLFDELERESAPDTLETNSDATAGNLDARRREQ